MSQQIKNFKDFKKLITSKTINKILLISGKNSYFKTRANLIFEKYFKNKNVYFYFKNSKLPEFNEILKIIKVKEELKPDLIIAVGGGCVMDMSKIANNFQISKDIKKRMVSSNFSKKNTKLLAIPTTAGSGAEVTANAVLYIKNIKFSVEGDRIKPNYYFLVPSLLSSINKSLDAASIFDAASQAVESLFSRRANKFSSNFAKQSFKILLKNYSNYFRHKNNYNSHKMLIGANLAGKAISISKTTAPHALSYPFTTKYGIPHGHAVSLTFNKFLKFNYFNLEKSEDYLRLKNNYDFLFKTTKTKNIHELHNFFLSFKKNLKLEQNFQKLGINFKNDANSFLKEINDQRLKNNPVKVVKKDIKYIINNY